jgi:hypothetical protein
LDRIPNSSWIGELIEQSGENSHWTSMRKGISAGIENTLDNEVLRWRSRKRLAQLWRGRGTFRVNERKGRAKIGAIMIGWDSGFITIGKAAS